MKKLSWFVMSIGMVLQACGENPSDTDVQTSEQELSNPDIRPNGKGNWISSQHARQEAATPRYRASSGISYHGGPVMLGTVNAYYIWYGNWPTTSPVPGILTDFMNHIGGSPYYNINTTYYNGSNVHLSNSVVLAGSTTDSYSQGTSLSDAQIRTVVTNAIQSGRLPLDSNGVYFVLTSADVSQGGFCSQFCGWHSYATINNANIKYAFVGDSTRCPSACQAQTAGPNGASGADGMASIIAHELEEAASDPNLTAWFDSRGFENADKCAWTFGSTYKATNGSYANMKMGTRDYLIQQNWVNASGGYCAKSYP